MNIMKSILMVSSSRYTQYKFEVWCTTSSSFPAVKEISELLNTGLDDETLKVCVQLLEAGVNPEALATVVLELRRESAALKTGDQVGAEMYYT